MYLLRHHCYKNLSQRIITLFSFSSIEPARIIEGPQDTKAIFGEDVILFCRATGNPEPQITFLWNSRELSPTASDGSGIGSSGLIVRTMPKGNGLTLRAKLQMSNNGDTVTCRVFNQFGTDSAKSRITVYDANERKNPCYKAIFN